jgi:hypothetical protein
MSELSSKTIEKFLKGVMEVERAYGHEYKNSKSVRQTEIRELLEKFAVKELDNESPKSKV